MDWGIAQDYQLRVESVHRQGQRAIKIHVDLNNSHHHARHLPEIEGQIINAQLPPQAEAWSLAVFRRLAEAEGAVHGIESDRVHFHEVGGDRCHCRYCGDLFGFRLVGDRTTLLFAIAYGRRYSPAPLTGNYPYLYPPYSSCGKCVSVQFTVMALREN